MTTIETPEDWMHMGELVSAIIKVKQSLPISEFNERMKEALHVDTMDLKLQAQGQMSGWKDQGLRSRYLAMIIEGKTSLCS